MGKKEFAQEIVNDVLRVARDLGGRVPTRDEYVGGPDRLPLGKYTQAQIREACNGGWRMLLQMSGIEYSRKGKRDKQEIRGQYYQHLLDEIAKLRARIFDHAPAKSLLAIGDTHAPYTHPDYVQFCIEVAKEYRCDRIVHVGDEVDKHAMSFHDSDPDLPSAGPELEAAIKTLEPWYKAFPEMDIAESNHGSLVYRKGKHHGFPRQVLRGYGEILRAPPGWKWHFEIKVPLSDGTDVLIHHSYGRNALKVSQTRGSSIIQGHHHSDAGVQWWANQERSFFAAFTGCGVDDTSLAMAYNKATVVRPLLGVTVTLEGICHWIPMLLDKSGRWVGKVPRVAA